MTQFMTIFREISRKEEKLKNEIKILEEALRNEKLRDPYFWTILERAIYIWPNLETAIDNTIWHKKVLREEFQSEENNEYRKLFFKTYNEKEQKMIKEAYYEFCKIQEIHIPFFDFLNDEYLYKINPITQNLRK